MPKKKRAMIKPKRPNKFSIHVSDSNLTRLEELKEQESHVTRNETINWCIEAIHLYYKYERLIFELGKLGK